MSIDDDGVVRGANAKAAELTGRPTTDARRAAARASSSSVGDRPTLDAWLAEARWRSGVDADRRCA